MCDSGRRGFTLIELMIVIAIIGIITAIAIPGILSMTRGANEEAAANSARSAATANARFMKDHKSRKYWMGDVYGLFRIQPGDAISGDAMKLVDQMLAESDASILTTAPSNTGDDTISYSGGVTVPPTPRAKQGYLLRVLDTWVDNSGGSNSYNYNSTGLNSGRFGYSAYPEAYAQGGKYHFKMETSTGGKIYRRDPGSAANHTTAIAASGTSRIWEYDPRNAGWVE